MNASDAVNLESSSDQHTRSEATVSLAKEPDQIPGFEPDARTT